LSRETALRLRFSIRTALVAALAVLGLAFAGSASAQRYVVLYEEVAPPGLAEAQVERAGGSVVAAYRRLGVVVAESSDPGFEVAIEERRLVVGAAPTAEYSSLVSPDGGDQAPGLGSKSDVDQDTFSGLQWGSDQIRAKKAHRVTRGSKRVLVGVIDTGIDATHPDIDDNLDRRRSVSCVGGAPNRDPAAWDDDSGHGTGVSGIIASEENGIGIVGVAPDVRFAAIKASVRDGARDVFLPEAVICAFVWAGSTGVDVANNSYSVDSAIVGGTTNFCATDPNQAVVIEAVRRAVGFAARQGVSVVASAGNTELDMAADPCVRLPSELPRVTTVAATGLFGTRASYSNFGRGVIDVAAPGGALDQGTPPEGLVLGPWPAKFQVPRLLCDPPPDLPTDPCPPPDGTPRSYYRFAFGTSEAAAHVSGVAALVLSRFGSSFDSAYGQGLSPRDVTRIIRSTADPVPCPDDPRCLDEGDVNGFYGHGIVNALRAVTIDRG
jgi:lantibiotic leader peptide-processing serine protease